jgi:hypothetical protein
MKARDPRSARNLREIPNVGPATEQDLLRLGIDHPGALIGQDGHGLYRKLCELDGKRHDPCVIDLFLSIIHFMETGEARPWHAFTAGRRKKWLKPGNP